MSIIVSAIQPTGNIHLGNYLGSIKNWIDLDKQGQCFFSIADLHSITVNLDNTDFLQENSYNSLATYLACGLDEKKSVLFKQSDIPYHSELFWLLSCFCQIGKLNRMIQFKDKAGRDKEKASLGLYAYPILMASDILLYNADIVPIGEDQLQHIELANQIVASFNHKYKQYFFKKIEPQLNNSSKRIMSLRNGNNKMSKSDNSDMSRINLSDNNDLIIKKIQKAKTDDQQGFDNLENRPEIKNLVNLYFSFAKNMSVVDIQERYNDLGNQKFKKDLADIIINEIEPISNKIKDLMKNKDFLDKIFLNGKEKAEKIALGNINKIKTIMGF